MGYGPDGATIHTHCGTSMSGLASLWDTRTGKPIERLVAFDPHILAIARSLDGVTLEAYSRDSATWVTGSNDKTARLWDVRTGRPLGTPMKHDHEITAVAFSPDGATVLTGSGDLGQHAGIAQLWDARTGKPIAEPMKHSGRVLVVAFCPDGTTMLTASDDATARLWDAHSCKPLGETMKHDSWVCAAAYSLDGATVLTGSYDKTARLWDARTGKPLGESMKHDSWVWAAAYSPDGATVLTGSCDKTARLWDARTGKPLGEPMEHGQAVRAVAYSPDGTSVLTGSDDATARLWLVPPLIPKRLVPLVVAAHCGMKMNDLGQIQPLSSSELTETRQAWKRKARIGLLRSGSSTSDGESAGIVSKPPKRKRGMIGLPPSFICAGV